MIGQGGWPNTPELPAPPLEEQAVLAAWMTDNQGFSVSESTVYLTLREEGPVKQPEIRMVAGEE